MVVWGCGFVLGKYFGDVYTNVSSCWCLLSYGLSVHYWFLVKTIESMFYENEECVIHAISLRNMLQEQRNEDGALNKPPT
jgi:hypothetical protein